MERSVNWISLIIWIVIIVSIISLVVVTRDSWQLEKSKGHSEKVAMDYTDEELIDLFLTYQENVYSELQKDYVYPYTKLVQLSSGETGSFAIGIRNLQEYDSSFSYNIDIWGDGNSFCEEKREEVLKWFESLSKKDIELDPNEIHPQKILVNVPEGVKSCEFRMKLDIYEYSEFYNRDFFIIKINQNPEA
jgi:hypothetical protein